MLTSHQRSAKCYLLRVVILQIQENCGFVKEVLSTTQYEDSISRAVNLEKSILLKKSWTPTEFRDGFCSVSISDGIRDKI